MPYTTQTCAAVKVLNFVFLLKSEDVFHMRLFKFFQTVVNHLLSLSLFKASFRSFEGLIIIAQVLKGQLAKVDEMHCTTKDQVFLTLNDQKSLVYSMHLCMIQDLLFQETTVKRKKVQCAQELLCEGFLEALLTAYHHYFYIDFMTYSNALKTASAKFSLKIL